MHLPFYSLPRHAEELLQCLQAGGLVLYPTEGVLGLGCDPYQEDAVARVKDLKKRDSKKGLICVASNWQQVEHWVQEDQVPSFSHIFSTWPGPVTWIFPASKQAPGWVQANGEVALRISNHPVICQLCDLYGGPLVSTSANPSGEETWTCYDDLDLVWRQEVDAWVVGEVGSLGGASKIFHAQTLKQSR